MKLSLWQQFTSNNSASYIVIGVFETPAAAQEAKEVFEQMIRDIIIARNPPPTQLRVPAQKIQQQYAQRYGIELHGVGLQWLDGFASYHPDQDVNTRMTLMDQYLIINPFQEGQRDDGEWLQYFVGEMGSGAYLRVNESGDFHFRVLCTPSDTEIAAQVYRTLESYFQQSRSIAAAPSPWVRESLIQASFPPWITPERYDGLVRAWHIWFETLRVADLHETEIEEAIDHLLQSAPLFDLLLWQWERLGIPGGLLTRAGLHVTIEEACAKDAHHLAPTLNSLCYWLESLGCEVSYEFFEEVQ